jgi:hypothetical protein
MVETLGDGSILAGLAWVVLSLACLAFTVLGGLAVTIWLWKGYTLPPWAMAPFEWLGSFFKK